MPEDHRSSIHPLRTALAAQGVQLSALFFAVFEKTKIPGTPLRQPRLMAPPGPSTSGGKRARQSLTLDPVEDLEGTSVIFGLADSSTKQVELRSWPAVAEGFRERFGQELDIPVAAYQRLLDKVSAFFEEQGFSIELLQDSPANTPPIEAPRSLDRLLWMMILLSTLALGIGIGILYMMVARE